MNPEIVLVIIAFLFGVGVGKYLLSNNSPYRMDRYEDTDQPPAFPDITEK